LCGACAGDPEVTDLAVGKSATQSSTKFEGHARLAVAVDKSDALVKCTHTFAETDPWWRVDLGGSKKIKFVEIQNTQECSVDLKNIEIRVGGSLVDNGNSNYLCSSPDTSKEYSVNATCNEAIGQFVNIIAKGHSRVLSLCHVRVWGFDDGALCHTANILLQIS
jgi:hypothetical protein